MGYWLKLISMGALVVGSLTGCGEETCPNMVCPCTAAGIRSAIASGGGPYTFDCDGPQTVVTEEEIVIRRSVVLDGEGKLTLDGDDDHRVLSVPERVTAELRGFTMTGGRIALPEEPPPLGEGGASGADERLELGAGVYNAGMLTLTNSTVSGNQVTSGDYYYGGGAAGIDNRGTLTLNGVTVTGNSCRCGAGGIGSEGTLTLLNSTVSENERGGIYNVGELTLSSSTVYQPDEGAIGSDYGFDYAGFSLVKILNSIVIGHVYAGSTVGIATFGRNVVPSLSDDWESTEEQVRLGPLADNGGPTETHALLPGSIAIDVADCKTFEDQDLTADQRGVSRPQGDGCDIGAVEWEQPPATAACQPSGRACYGVDMVEPIEPMCEIDVPDQPNGCGGTESVENPMSCTASGATVSYALTKIKTVSDCNAGYDLDDCYGLSCVAAGLASFDGVDGVDNGLGAAGLTFLGIGGDLGSVDQLFHDSICAGDIDIEIVVDSVPEEACAVVTVSAAGLPGDPIPMNLSDDGCLSGTLGTIPIRLGEVDGSIDNAVLRATVSETGISDGILGGTAEGATAAPMMDAVMEGFGAVTGQFFDIKGDLSGDVEDNCDALSMTLEIGGTAIVAESR